MPEHETYRQWIDLEVEGELPAAESRRLAEHMADCAQCRAERRRLEALHHAFDEARIDVRPDLRERVMAALPSAGRRAAPVRTGPWVAAALIAALGTLSALLLGATSDPGLPLLGAAAALVEMGTATLVAGAGLLGASWSGLGMAVGELFRSEPAVLVVSAVLLLLLSGLVVSLLRRPRAVERTAERTDRG